MSFVPHGEPLKFERTALKGVRIDVVKRAMRLSFDVSVDDLPKHTRTRLLAMAMSSEEFPSVELTLQEVRFESAQVGLFDALRSDIDRVTGEIKPDEERDDDE